MEFTAHNIQLDNGITTMQNEPLLAETQRCKALIRTLNLHFRKEERSQIKIVDLGCLEGGYSIEFARHGYQVTGIEARELNILKCDYALKNLNLPNLKFEKDDVKNIEKYGEFDVVFCSGLLYHLDNPYFYLKTLGKLTKKLLLLHTHYSLKGDPFYDRKSNFTEKLKNFFSDKKKTLQKHNFFLSGLTVHEGKKGRWFNEYALNTPREQVENALWTSYSNHRSFWIEKKDLLQSITEAGFPIVYEQYDFLENIAEDNYIDFFDRSLFMGVKTV